MKTRTLRFGALFLFFIPLFLSAPRALAQTEELTGQVLDMQGKPYPDVVITLSDKDTGTVYTVKTDKDGKFHQIGMQPGTYKLNFKKDDIDYDLDGVNPRTYEGKPVLINFKDIAAKTGYDPEAAKKKADAEKKFNTMKTHFNDGRVAITDSDALRGQLQTAPADQVAALLAKRSTDVATAISEFEQAQKAAPDKDPNLPIVNENLAAAYASQGELDRMALHGTPIDQRDALKAKIASEYAQAATTLQQAIDVKPTAPRYMDLGTYLAYSGKMSDATAACDKAATLAPTDATSSEGCYRNIGIVLTNSDNMKDAVAPLQKATQLNPKDAQAWFLLGSALLNTMPFKTVDGKEVPTILPGTAEAFQKYLELDPNGPHAADAKGSLDALQQMGGGIPTKEATKKKKNP